VSARGKARKRALDVLYEADLRGLDPLEVLGAKEGDEGLPNPYTRELVEGVVAHASRIDEVLATYAQGWTVERMPAVDRNVLRMGVYELLWADEVPDPVVISEAVALVASLSTDESGPFVNGLLARIAEVGPTLSRD
jgi:N utilization substance protein B